eukprot:351505-Chlamydomonas_euryale.AAC.8
MHKHDIAIRSPVRPWLLPALPLRRRVTLAGRTENPARPKRAPAQRRHAAPQIPSLVKDSASSGIAAPSGSHRKASPIRQPACLQLGQGNRRRPQFTAPPCQQAHAARRSRAFTPQRATPSNPRLKIALMTFPSEHF